MRTLSACEINSRVLSSDELVELLYMAYNRDDAEVYGIDKAIKAGYDELYTTAQDVVEKQMKELDKEIEEKALKRAKKNVYEVRNEKQKSSAYGRNRCRRPHRSGGRPFRPRSLRARTVRPV